MKLIVDERWRVSAMHEIALPLRASVVWGQMRDLRTFLTIDPLHAHVRTSGPADAASLPVGTPLVIEHRLFGIGPDRVGRLLQWREGRGFAVSDLSQRGVDVGFPHVCQYEVEPSRSGNSRLRITVRGRWTARRVPRPIVKLWLWWVMFNTARRIEWYFAVFRPRRGNQRI